MRARLLFCWIMWLLTLPAFSQIDREVVQKLVEEDRATIDALVMYPEDTRRAILEAALYPELLIRVQSMQQTTSAKFRELLEPYALETQEAVYELSRYPGLIEKIVAGGPKNNRELRAIALDYPDGAKEYIVETGEANYALLNRIDVLQAETDRMFNSLIGNYPPETREAYLHLLNLPEVLNILAEDIRLTVITGDLYRKDPQWVIGKTDSLHLEVARENARELEAWKNELAADPRAREELESVASEYESEYGYDDEYYNEVEDDLYYRDGPDDRVIVEHHYYNYPYWLGYPYWYTYPRWRPYPVWWDCGFYFQAGNIVIVRLPSFYFTHWYFHRHHHHYYYPHLTTRFIHHYYGYRHTSGTIIAGVESWRNANRNIITEDWMKRDGRIVDRVREFGQMEINREKYNARNPGNKLDQFEYLDRNKDRYRELEKVAVRQPVRGTDEGLKREPLRPSEKEKELIRKAPVQKTPDKTERTGPYKRPEKQAEPQKIDKAKERHKSIWDLTRQKRPEPAKRPSTAPEKKPGQKQPPVKNAPPKKDPPKRKPKQNG